MDLATEYIESVAAIPWWVYALLIVISIIILVLFMRIHEYIKAIKQQSEIQTELLQSIKRSIDEKSK